MKMVSIKKVSVLGVILTVTSSVTAAIMSEKVTRQVEGVNNGTLRTGIATVDSDVELVKTCVTNPDGGMPECTKTEDSATTEDLLERQSTVGGFQTNNNTSNGIVQSQLVLWL